MIYLVTADDGNIESYAALTRRNKNDYADKHGYAYWHLSPQHSAWDASLSPAWNLVAAVRHVLFHIAEKGDWIFLSGADACVVSMDMHLSVSDCGIECITGKSSKAAFDLEDFTFDLLITRDENGLNTNGLLLRVCEWSRKFIESVWALRGQIFSITGPNGVVHQWEEQGAFIRVLEESGMMEHVTYIPQEITNGYPPEAYGNHYKQPIFMAHFPGKQKEERTYFIKRALGLLPNVPLPQAHWIDDSGNIRTPQ